MSSYRDLVCEAYDSPAALERMRPVFRELRSSTAALSRFTTLEDALAFLHDRRRGKSEENDSILLALLEAHQQGRPGVAAMLTRAMRPMIESLCSSVSVKASSDVADRLAADVYGAFVTAIDGYPRGKRPHRVAANLSFLTLRAYLDVAGAREARIRNALNARVRPLLACDEDGDVADAVPLLAFVKPEKRKKEPDAPPSAADLEAARKLARSWVEQAVVSTEDAELLVQAHVLGRSAQALADEHGIQLRGMQKRLARIRTRLHRAHEEGEISCEFEDEEKCEKP